MYQNELFANTRWRLAGWYAGVMAIILGLSSWGLYQSIANTHELALDRELEAVAGTLHDSIEPTLDRPEGLKQLIQQLSSNTCIAETDCLGGTATQEKRHVLGAIYQGNYYLRLIDSSGRTIALVGLQPKGLSLTPGDQRWQTTQDHTGNRYHQISLHLHTEDNLWGYMQVGRLLNDVDEYLATVRWILLLGFPIALVLVAGSSWWLAGLAMRPIYQSYQQTQQFTADAAHELRTPLAATQATVESALRLSTLPEPEARDILQAVERQNNRLAQLVKDLLLLSRSNQQTLTTQRQPCCLNDLIGDLVEEFAALAIKADVTLHTNVQGQEKLYVLGHEEQLYRLVSNLIVNAIQYTASGGEVTVILKHSDHSALIQVQDTGIGIAPADQMRIFDRFYRVSSDRSRQTGGAGLGLAIAQAIAQTHHGSLQVQSQQGKGSTFTVRLLLHERP